MKPALRWAILGVALLGAGWLALFTEPYDAGANRPGGDAARNAQRDGGARDGSREATRDASRSTGRDSLQSAPGPKPTPKPTAERSRSQRDSSEILELRVRTASSENLKSLFAAANFAPPRPVAVAAPRPAPAASVAVVAAPPPVVAPAPAPTAPPLPFIFVGKHFDGNRWEVFVSRGEQTLILRAGQIIDANYRVETVAPPRMVITYVPLDEKQTLNIGSPQ
jgi:hypothetical protein